MDKTKLMLNSTQVEDVVEVGVELGNTMSSLDISIDNYHTFSSIVKLFNS